MAGNQTGLIFRLSTYGESHGVSIGGIIDGCPAGLKIDLEFIQQELDSRKPGNAKWSSARKESDQVNILSGVLNGISTGMPIAFQFKNEDKKSDDYDHLKNTYRPSHADYVYEQKFGIRDHRGGGRSSARETASWVFAGAIAQLILKQIGIQIHAYVHQVGSVTLPKDYAQYSFEHGLDSLLPCPDQNTRESMLALIEEARKEGDTLGGVVQTVVKNCKVGWGEPVFDKLHADLGKAMLGINAVKGFEIGSGFAAAAMKGSEHNDAFEMKGDKWSTKSNFSGGIQGGISNGEDIHFKVAFKPIATLMKDQESLDKDGNKIILKGKGRHDPCVLPRAVPIVKARTALVLVDHYLRNRNARIE